MADDLTATLDQIKADHEAANAFGANASDPVPRLIAAIERVLENADEWDAEARRIDAKFAGEEDAWPRTVAGMRAQAFEQCAKTARAAITEALAKEETP